MLHGVAGGMSNAGFVIRGKLVPQTRKVSFVARSRIECTALGWVNGPSAARRTIYIRTEAVMSPYYDNSATVKSR